ncbi:hypothetical protein POTOM_014279 [Populus tomentosa]|uniref:Enoyl-CoA hydratase/isomerase family protein n=1 Tax=Populus tomentosa TaxID=118781 RepID=A0A8X8A4B4_POPTO|nr:hypothetical protein POTOM_014279 [Populus tomentosa]
MAIRGDIKLSSPTLNQLLIPVFLLTEMKWKSLDCVQAEDKSSDAITAIERCRKPVIAAIEGACIGGGTDIMIACDIWFRSKDAFFSVKEAGLGLTADSWTLQRLSGIVELRNAMELALTGLRFSGQEAKDLGLVCRVFGSRGIA